MAQAAPEPDHNRVVRLPEIDPQKEIAAVSKRELDGKLQNARVTVSAGQFAKIRICDACIRQPEVCPIEQIEPFKPELPYPTLAQHGKPEALHQGDTKSTQAGTFKDVSAQGAERV